MSAQPREIRQYITAEGKIPFDEWINSLRDIRAKARIEQRLDRLLLGNLGDYKPIGDGIYELRIDYGNGYRIYFGQIGLVVILLLCGGDKSTQNRDIRKAKEYWQDFRRQNNE
ncbi:type II toxin-antitoxin system RelE/ParE family toxin [Pseudanabaena sp. BC1403]|uniref:type II toxin-antitoxin system RelE/ParE family toxin n=1 Tax=Pseudanabaena sp. BC1403 TaxID=2043171 RepID=UPI000CD888AA|nr:type II toxin-antitoxin system RelE/ParE family toxin [Pseudanabaena sp. BC1403]